MDKLHAMQTFVRIVERGSLTAAAEDLNTSLPTVVRTLAALEGHLGARLFNRTTRRIHLTDEGRQYLAGCRAALSAVEAAEVALAMRRQEPQGRLAVTAPVLFGRNHVAPVMNAFLARHRKVQGELLLVDHVVDLIETGMDVGIRIGRLADSSLVAVPVAEVRRVVCASPKYLERHGVPRSPKALSAHRCVSFAGLSPAREWRFGDPRRGESVAIEPILVTNQIDAAIGACVAGLGPALFLSYQVAPYRASKQLRYILEDFEPQPLPVQLVYPHARLMSGTARAFVVACTESLANARLV